MNCQEVLNQIEDYSYGELRATESAVIADHLKSCTACNDAYQALQAEDTFFTSYHREMEVNPQIWEAIEARIASSTASSLPNISRAEAIPELQKGFDGHLPVSKAQGEVMASNIFTFIEVEPIWNRVASTMLAAFQEFQDHPKQFIAELFYGDPLQSRRKRFLRVGMAFAISFWCLCSTVYLVWAFHTPKAVTDDTALVKIADLTPFPAEQLNLPKAAQRASGGGGGGDHELTPPSKGRPPKASMENPIVAPTTHPPEIKNPSLPVLPTIQVDPNLMAKMPTDIPLGDPKGIPGPPSDGPGAGGGIGTSSGGGIGDGDGTGLGRGRGKGTNGGDYSQGGNNGDDSIYTTGNGVRNPQILSKQKPKYTEEARRDKIQGVVVLSAVFGKNGTITDVRVIRGLGYGLDEEAVKAALLIKFVPGTRDGRPANVRARLEFTFSLL